MKKLTCLANAQYASRRSCNINSLEQPSTDTAAIAETQNWEVRRDELVGVASAIYLWMPDHAELWLARDRFELFERTRV